MSGGFTKLFGSIVTSSIWIEDDATLRVWIAMLAIANAEGIVEGSVPGFASLARVTTEQMQAAVDKLGAPDPYSRTPDFDGRRIEVIEGGWRILNYRTYRERGQGKDGSRAPYYRAYRARQVDVARNTETSSDVASNTEDRGRVQSTEKEEGESPSASAPPLRAEELQRLWNETTSPPIPRCVELTTQRRRHAEARLRERGLDGMRDVFARINAIPFCRGENDRGWLATIDWALKPGSIVKVLEGAYAGGSRTHRTTSEESPAAKARMQKLLERPPQPRAR